MRSALCSAALLVLAACADPEMEKRVADLETQVKELSAKVEKGGGANANAASPEQEKAAGDLYRAANEAAEKGDYETAKAKLAELTGKYGDTRTAKRAERMVAEMGVIGQAAPPLEVEKWYQGNASFADGEATLVVFWESWCPHCQREVPKLIETHEKYKAKGLNVVGLTKVTRSSTEEKVEEFIKEHKIPYPMAKEKGGSMSEVFAVSGIPAAAVVKDGKIVWRGHPAKLTDEMIEGWLQG